MEKFFKIFAFFMGTLAMITGTTACGDDEECCSWTDDFGDAYSYCEDGNLPAGATWTQVQAAAEYYNGTCD